MANTPIFDPQTASDFYAQQEKDEDAKLFQDVRNEITMRDFLENHPIGIYFTNRAQQDLARVARDMSLMDYDEAQKEFPRLYAEARFHQRLIQWVDSILSIGESAQHQLLERDRKETF